MHTGMLWFDNSQTALTVKIQKAVDKNQRQIEINKLTVRPYRPVLPGHIWIGIEDKN